MPPTATGLSSSALRTGCCVCPGKSTMSRVCQVTGRRTRVGNKVARRGLAKKKGGVGRRVTGRSKRKFKPNIHRVRVLDPDGRVLRLKLSARAIKTGVITLKRGDRTVSFPLVRALRGRNREFTRAQRPQEASA